MKQILLILIMAFSQMSNGQGTFDFGISKMNRISGAISSIIDLSGTGEFNPASSPDNRYVAFDIVSPVDPHRVGVSTLSGSLVTVFTGSADGANNPTWSADGSTIAVDKAPFGDLSVYAIDVSSGVASHLIADAVDPAYSHRGGSKQYLSFTRPSDGLIYTYHIPSGTTTPITPGENAKWSPNDRKLVYSLSGDVYTIRINSSGSPAGSPRLVAGDPVYTESRPDWISMNEVVFHADYSGDFDLYRKRVRGTAPIIRIGGNTGTNDYDPDYSGSGRFILFSEGQNIIPSVSRRELTLGSFNISPNPAKEYIITKIDLPDSQILNLEMYDLQGNLMMSEKLGFLNEGIHEFRISLPQNIIPGIHLIRIKGERDFVQSNKVIIQ